jgi:transposase InsO family protein
MAWRESCVMDARLSFIAACLRGDEAISRVCERFGISRKTGHKWLARYHAAGAVCLMPRSSARHTQGHRIDEATAARVIALRAAHPTWGPRKLRARLSLDEPETAWPAASTIGDLLRRSGHVRPRRQRRAPMLGKKRELTQATAANMVWSADFKGWFRTGDGVRCEALTITDSYSRYVLCCQALPQVTFAVVRSAMIRVFEAHGLPAVLRTDNGNPFARRDSLCGLTQFSVWLLLLGVRPEMIVPGRPDMNGRHERMHRVVQKIRPGHRHRRCWPSNDVSIFGARPTIRCARMRLWANAARRRFMLPRRGRIQAGWVYLPIHPIISDARSSATVTSPGAADRFI